MSRAGWMLYAVAVVTFALGAFVVYKFIDNFELRSLGVAAVVISAFTVRYAVLYCKTS